MTLELQRKRRQRVDGVLLLDKPAGITSNAAIQRVKRLFNAEKAGHVGTLDPMATGLLPVCLGEATKFSSDAFSADKSYEAAIQLGVTTTTGDAEGEITSQCAVDVSPERLDAVLKTFIGELKQVPPMHSALKRDGKPLYAYARSGVTLERQPRAIVIHALHLLRFSGSRLSIDVSCSKGTYIRVLAEDIGAALGCGASLYGLRRTRVGSERVDQAIGLPGLESMPEAERASVLRPVDSLAAGLPRIDLDSQAEARVLKGQRPVVDVRVGAEPGTVRIYGAEGRFLGLADLAASGILTPKRLIASSTTPSAG